MNAITLFNYFAASELPSLLRWHNLFIGGLGVGVLLLVVFGVSFLSHRRGNLMYAVQAGSVFMGVILVLIGMMGYKVGGDAIEGYKKTQMEFAERTLEVLSNPAASVIRIYRENGKMFAEIAIPPVSRRETAKILGKVVDTTRLSPEKAFSFPRER